VAEPGFPRAGAVVRLLDEDSFAVHISIIVNETESDPKIVDWALGVRLIRDRGHLRRQARGWPVADGGKPASRGSQHPDLTGASPTSRIAAS
jgi:hypothetical protein